MTVVATPASSAAAVPPGSAARGGMPLQKKLPLLMATILVVVLASSLALTYRELARASERALAERVTSVARQLASLLDAGIRVRSAAVERVARDPVVQRVVGAAPSAVMAATDRDSVEALLASLRVPADSLVPVELWTVDGRRVARVGPPLDVDAPAEPHRMTPAPNEAPSLTSARYGHFFALGPHVYYHLTAPVRDGARTLGYLVQMRQLGGQPQAASQFKGLLGADIALYLHNSDGSVWTSLDGAVIQPPTATSEGRAARAGVGELFASNARIAGTPWTISLEAPIASARRAPRAVLLSLTSIAIVLTLAGAAAAWAMGRRITQPVGELTAAVEAISRGDYRSRVPEHGDDEVARLARTFNRMATEVDTSHRQLGAQYDDARRVAGELEEAYAALQNAMVEVEEARDAAETANRAKSDFLAVMSHELRTPLNAIGGYVELMQMGIHGPITDAQSHALTRIARSHTHLLGLINDVLNFTRLGAGHVEFAIRDVALDDVLASVESMLAPQIDAKGLRYARVCGDVAPVVRADGDKVQQILVNLLSNAVKFTATGGHVTLGCHVEDAVVSIVVRDTGIGIPPDRMRAIFEPFVQVDRALTRPHDGVGLGLAISRDLARGMSGDVTAESVPNEGSSFTLTLPAAHRATSAQRSTGAA